MDHVGHFEVFGVFVCERWLPSAGGSEANFLSDVGPAPAGAALERVDLAGDFTPGNVRWSPRG